MSLARVSQYVADMSHDPSSMWRQDDLLALSKTPPPESMLKRNDIVLRADAYALWFRWFIEGLCNPLRYIDESKTILDVFVDTKARIDNLYANEPQDERGELAKRITTHVMAEVNRHRQIMRINASKEQKRELIDSAVGVPRCWMCGFAFSQAAIDKFLLKPIRDEVVTPQFVDILRPRGLYPRDVSIEVEHIVPVAAGGGGANNLALACGWCNKSKGARTSIYDAGARAPRAMFRLGEHTWHELPHPFWTVRLLAMRRRCEHIDGCTATADNSELFIAPADHRGSPIPNNLHIFCSTHDPYASTRFYGRESARRIWAGRKRASG